RTPPLPLLLIAALATCQSSADSLADAERGMAEQEVRDALAALMDDMNAHDADGVLAHYENSEDFIYAGVSDIHIGWEAFARTVAPWYGSHEDVTFSYEIVQIRVLSADVALAVLEGSSTEASSLVWTEVLKKDADGRWLIVHEHESWPGAAPPPPPHPM
ncbi:MAG TPA: nuclear transport factor 2 family protein, partial [Longimicrobiales bacterium]|nr:nuclear transport factor 2 family protein [Longimicrobiales bacterium]